MLWTSAKRDSRDVPELVKTAHRTSGCSSVGARSTASATQGPGRRLRASGLSSGKLRPKQERGARASKTSPMLTLSKDAANTANLGLSRAVVIAAKLVQSRFAASPSSPPELEYLSRGASYSSPSTWPRSPSGATDREFGGITGTHSPSSSAGLRISTTVLSGTRHRSAALTTCGHSTLEQRGGAASNLLESKSASRASSFSPDGVLFGASI